MMGCLLTAPFAYYHPVHVQYQQNNTVGGHIKPPTDLIHILTTYILRMSSTIIMERSDVTSY
jgi:hypothetical protein